jgi:hypothetical protein
MLKFGVDNLVNKNNSSSLILTNLVLKFGVNTHVNKNNYSSLILTNLELKFEACMLNLIWK